MKSNEVEFFIHTQGANPKVLTGASTDTLQEVLLRSGVLRDAAEDTLVFLGECEEALLEDVDSEGGADEHAPVDVHLTLEVLEIERHRHVHCHSCRHIAVEVNFGGKSKARKFSPATTIAVVTQWARKKFKLDATAATEYVLQVCGSTEQPRSDKHLGELVQSSNCSICFDLVREVTPQG